MAYTLEEIARLAGVSRSTVSRVVNNDPNVSDRTRERVNQVIQDINFQPNRAARSLAGGQTRVLGLVIPQGVGKLFTDPYFPTMIQGVTSTCNAHDYSVMLWLAEPEYERRMTGQILSNGLIDGVIVSSMMEGDPVVQALSEGHLPFILIGRHPTDDCACYVDVDNFNSAREAVNYLLRQGRRRVATVTGPQDMLVGVDRLEGYLAALRERGLTPQRELIADGDFTEAGGYEAARRLLPKKPDAIFAASDPMALGVLRALQEQNIKVPKDVAVIGFDDIPQSATATPPLTTMRQPIRRLGATAAETLIEMVEASDYGPRRIILPTELIIRVSA